MQDDQKTQNPEFQQEDDLKNPVTPSDVFPFEEDSASKPLYEPDIPDEPEVKPRNTGKISLILSLVALAGMIFILVVNGIRPAGNDLKPTPIVQGSGGPVTGTRVAYVRADSVQNNYLMTIHFLDSIERRFRSMENDLMEKKKGYEKKIQNYYRDVQSGLLKESAALGIKEKLEAEGDNIASLEEGYTTRINDLQLKLNVIYFDSLWNFLERSKQAIGFDMVVGYQQGLTNIFFADKNLDITHQVIELMNQEYAEKYPDRKNLKKKPN